MTSRSWPAVLLLALGVWPGVAAAPQQPAGLTLRASVRTEALDPGDIALVHVTASRAPVSVDGRAFGRTVRFWPSGVPGEWSGFVGIALDTAPGTYELSVQASTSDGQTGASILALRIRDKKFETRRLTVSSRFVDPPAAEGERIAREAKLLASLFTDTGTERLWRGPFALPVPGNATSSFGRLSVLNGTPRGRHQGADFSASVGTPIRAPNAGKVVLAADLYFSGNTIVLDHGVGLFSLFAHLSRMRVKPDEVVATGDVVGEAGATGRVTGPHLHWAVRLGEFSVNPMSLMSAVANLTETPATP